MFKILKDNIQPTIQNLNNADEVRDWYKTVTDDTMKANLRFFVHQYVPLPESHIDPNIHQAER